MVRSVLEHLKTKNCKGFQKLPFVIRYAFDLYESWEMCDNVIL